MSTVDITPSIPEESLVALRAGGTSLRLCEGRGVISRRTQAMPIEDSGRAAGAAVFR
jgi:hypothetical protein